MKLICAVAMFFILLLSITASSQFIVVREILDSHASISQEGGFVVVRHALENKLEEELSDVKVVDHLPVTAFGEIKSVKVTGAKLESLSITTYEGEKYNRVVLDIGRLPSYERRDVKYSVELKSAGNFTVYLGANTYRLFGEVHELIPQEKQLLIEDAPDQPQPYMHPAALFGVIAITMVFSIFLYKRLVGK